MKNYFNPINMRIEYIKSSCNSYFFICENDCFIDYDNFIKLSFIVDDRNRRLSRILTTKI